MRNPVPESNLKKIVHDLLGFKSNWKEVYDNNYFRDLTSNQRLLRK